MSRTNNKVWQTSFIFHTYDNDWWKLFQFMSLEGLLFAPYFFCKTTSLHNYFVGFFGLSSTSLLWRGNKLEAHNSENENWDSKLKSCTCMNIFFFFQTFWSKDRLIWMINSIVIFMQLKIYSFRIYKSSQSWFTKQKDLGVLEVIFWIDKYRYIWSKDWLIWMINSTVIFMHLKIYSFRIYKSSKSWLPKQKRFRCSWS